MTDLSALAERIEAAEGPNAQLDCAIGYAVCPGRESWPLYTASIDAAMTLVPEGWGLSITRYWIANADGPVWAAEIATGGLPDKPRRVFDCYDKATPALALAAAALRARSQGGTDNG